MQTVLVAQHGSSMTLFSNSVSASALDASERLASGTVDALGSVYTKPEVCRFMLDLIGYKDEADLVGRSILEPSVGGGAFLFEIVTRLLASFRGVHGDPTKNANCLLSCIRAVEIHTPTFKSTGEQLARFLVDEGFSKADALRLRSEWLINADFLLWAEAASFDFAVGNPPYIRQENIEEALLLEYRERFSTIYDRADIYIPFFEKVLKGLAPQGVMSFICTDRWVRNRYGGPLRKLITSQYHLEFYIDLFDTEPFNQQVATYPSIVVVRSSAPDQTTICERESVDLSQLPQLARRLRNGPDCEEEPRIAFKASLTSSDEPWPIESQEMHRVLRRLERDFQPIESVGCKVGIGVATGADSVFIRESHELPIEESRKLPLVKTTDIKEGTVNWQGLVLANPFDEQGSLVDLEEFPKLKKYFEEHEARLRRRACAKRRTNGWYKTIDKIHYSLRFTPKLLIPDIKGRSHVVFEEGKFYPHHNLYFITSTSWNLWALKAVLTSPLGEFFVASYSTKMRGGYIRYQAQFLRKICLPQWSAVPPSEKRLLISAGKSGDQARIWPLVSRLFDLNDEESQVITERMSGVSKPSQL